jgi:membrane protein DedA with SNARE-associated domain
MDLLGQILWFLILGTPLVTIPIVWKLSKQKKIIRILIGFVVAIILSFLLYYISLSIIFRDGMGPG